ncbi:pilB [Symbiodinium sp. KB8]|nr:pilB [Symbiodinium sp. KB8]
MVTEAPKDHESPAATADGDRRFLEEALRNAPAGEAAEIERLATMGMIPMERAYQIWADMLGLTFYDLDNQRTNPHVRHLIPVDLVSRHETIPISTVDGVLVVALKNPFDLAAVDEVQEVTGMSVEVALATPDAIRRAIERLHRGAAGIEGLIQKLEKAEIDTVADGDSLRRLVGHDAVVQLVDHLIEESLQARASDLHVEPQRDQLRLRVRIDGEMQTLYELPPGLHRAVVARIKVASGMDIGESRKAQDGRIAVSDNVELRVSVLPSVLGEKAVLRVLDRSTASHDPASLEMSPANLDRFRRAYTHPTGMDPVEYEMAGATQVQVDPKADRTFAKALRSILRQDPDVVMVGEIRDTETAAIAVQAALTGHMVLSTLHTNDALAAVHRLDDMDVAPYLLGPALRAVVGQRLVPRICKSCSTTAEPMPGLLAEFGLDPDGRHDEFRTGSGCATCRGRGRRGRIAIHEVLYITPEIAAAISRKAAREEVHALADAAGYRPMLMDGLDKARAGLVTLEDVAAIARIH